ncbi:MAG: CoA-binding protein, partial [Anaerolineaceae bacterium]|nr:CoA-binding protein [Anaerolineaceae bacterium]
KPCYPDITAVPDPVELAVLVIPAGATPQTLEACGQRGIHAAIIISGGFKEVGSGGADLEKECLDIARRHSMRLIGPNCVGAMNLHNGLNTTFINGMPEEGGIGFLSQSGAICGGVVDMVHGKKVGFSHFLSLGNEADVTETDIIEYLGADPRTRVIAAYVEQIRDGRRFLEVARRVSQIKPIVLIKAGRTSAGARAVSSHTGSLAGSHTAYQAAFQQAGVIEVQTFAELFDVALAFDTQPIPAGKNAVIITNAGGPAALASDSLSANGFTLGDLSEATRSELRAHLNPSAQVSNPIDMLGGAEPADYELAVRTALADPQIDAVIPLLVPQALVSPAGVAQAVVDAVRGAKKTVLACVVGDESVGEARLILQGNRIPMYTVPETMGRVLAAMRYYRDWRGRDHSLPAESHASGFARAEAYLKTQAGISALGEAAARPLLEAYGFPVVQADRAGSAGEAARVAEKIGFPVVMKVISPDILHKSDVGGIRLGLNSAAEVETAYAAMLQGVAAKAPQARIEGVLIEQSAPHGQEVIIGMKRDPGFGPLLMFGLGGIYVELFKDVSFRVAPIGEQEALEMVQATRAGRLLTGFRGQAPADVAAVVDCLCRLSQLALDFPQISEIEVNPLQVFEAGRGVLALDARVLF